MLAYIVSLKNHRNPSGLYDNNNRIRAKWTETTWDGDNTMQGKANSNAYNVRKKSQKL